MLTDPWFECHSSTWNYSCQIKHWFQRLEVDWNQWHSLPSMQLLLMANTSNIFKHCFEFWIQVSTILSPDLYCNLANKWLHAFLPRPSLSLNLSRWFNPFPSSFPRIPKDRSPSWRLKVLSAWRSATAETLVFLDAKTRVAKFTFEATEEMYLDKIFPKLNKYHG